MAKKKKVVKKSVKKPVKKIGTKKIVKKTVPKKKAPAKAKKVVKQNIKPLVIQKQSPKKIDYTKAVTPLGERLVVRADQAETLTAGGLYLPDPVDTIESYVNGVV